MLETMYSQSAIASYTLQYLCSSSRQVRGVIKTFYKQQSIFLESYKIVKYR